MGLLRGALWSVPVRTFLCFGLTYTLWCFTTTFGCVSAGFSWICTGGAAVATVVAVTAAVGVEVAQPQNDMFACMRGFRMNIYYRTVLTSQK